MAILLHISNPFFSINVLKAVIIYVTYSYYITLYLENFNLYKKDYIHSQIMNIKNGFQNVDQSKSIVSIVILNTKSCLYE